MTPVSRKVPTVDPVSRLGALGIMMRIIFLLAYPRDVSTAHREADRLQEHISLLGGPLLDCDVPTSLIIRR